MDNTHNAGAVKRTVDMLLTVLEREFHLHETMLLVAEKKQQAIIEGDLPGLEEVVGEEKSLIESIEEEEVKRKTIMPMVVKALQCQNTVEKISELVALLPEPEKSRLAETREKLHQILERCRAKTRQNAELLKVSMAHVDAFLRTVAEAAARDTSYTKDGKKTAHGPALLDRSA